MEIYERFRPPEESLKNQVWEEGWQGISIDDAEVVTTQINPKDYSRRVANFEVTAITILDRPLVGKPDFIIIRRNSYSDREEAYVLSQVYFSQYEEDYSYHGDCVKYAIFDVADSILSVKSGNLDGKDSYDHFRVDRPPVITYTSLEDSSAKPRIIDLGEKLHELGILIDP